MAEYTNHLKMSVKGQLILRVPDEHPGRIKPPGEPQGFRDIPLSEIEIPVEFAIKSGDPLDGKR